MRIKYDPTQESTLRVNVLYSEREADTRFYVELLPIRKTFNLTNILGEQKAHATIRHLAPGKYKVILRGDITEIDIYQEKEKSSGEFSQIIEVDLKPDEQKVITFNLGSELAVEFMVFIDNQPVDKAAVTIPKTQSTKFIKNSKPVIFALKPDFYSIIIEIQSYRVERFIKIEPEDEIFNFYVSSQEIMASEWNAELKKKSLDSVIMSAATLLEKHPEYPDINFFIGRLYSVKRDYKKAYLYFQSALKHNNRFLDAFIYTGLLLIRTGYFDKSIVYLKKARDLNPFINDKCFEAGMEAIRLNRPSEAEGLIAKAFEYNPFLLEMCSYSLDEIPAYIDFTNIAKEFFYRGKLDKSKEAIKKLLKLQPNYVDMLYIAGLIEYYQNNYDEAIHHLNKAYRNNPNFIPVLLLLGRIFYKLEKHNKSQEYFFRVLTIDKDNRIGKTFITKIKAKRSSKPDTEEIEITYS